MSFEQPSLVVAACSVLWDPIAAEYRYRWQRGFSGTIDRLGAGDIVLASDGTGGHFDRTECIASCSLMFDGVAWIDARSIVYTWIAGAVGDGLRIRIREVVRNGPRDASFSVTIRRQN